MAGRDDDAFRWEGDDDPTLRATPDDDAQRAEPAAEAAGDGAAERDAQEAPAEEPERDDEPASTGNVALIAYGVLGGVYALWTVGWVLGTNRVRDWILAQPGSVPDPMFHASTVLSILAPALWFGATLLLTRAKPTWMRFVALALGALVLIPWPFVTVGVIGS